MKTAYFRIHEEDNVAIALEQLEPGCEIQFTGGCCTAAEVIPRGHKVALSDLEPGQDVIKYGYPIGHATKRVRAGSWVHSHNMCTNLEGTLEYEYRPLRNHGAQWFREDYQRRSRRAEETVG